MNPNTGELYGSIEDARAAGVKNAVELIGSPEDVQRVSEAVSAQYRAKRRAKRKAQKRARRGNR